MKIFHLFANHKFTGPADLAMVMASSQQAAGAEVRFFSSTHPDAENSVEQIARSRGLETVTGLRLAKHLRWTSLPRDVSRLRRSIEAERPDFLHCHLDGDHLLACLACGKKGPGVIRSSYQLDPPSGWRAAWTAARTRLWLPPSSRAEDRLLQQHPKLRGRTRITAPPVDLQRFAPAADPGLSADRDAPVVIGVVARMQRHRRFPQLIEAFAAAAAEDSRLQLVILGRGTHQDEVARIPAQQTGLGDRIRFAGYIDPDLYPQQLRRFDLLLFLVPGSDGTCRAAREALACGVPVIASRRGLLPDLIPEQCGLLLQNEAVDTMTRAILTLARDPLRRKGMADNARQHAQKTFDAKTLGSDLIADLAQRSSASRPDLAQNPTHR
ncbi:MAG: glycosyltransferase family 4 protein [Planctomycetes bacterium]|nr:glycosyltransferase family 4 protein [Planctomycetota bacterium]MBT6540437.1 glycosyltransferase family 4 protein [Planctomycetota bacterium]MBT6784361.1 glycosyltransferase family 4 protein [Planctomycetota bacterium]MBT6967426.1 glycosyltransferase family 4 protein [Planctomycetota bacterium]MBT7104115.1 glycosyltransferase family 4 protein [Planctomycetota bacterium]